jgi:hypothetical protein
MEKCDGRALVNDKQTRFCYKVHTYSKVDAGDTIKYKEYVCIRELGETEVEPSWKQEHQNLEIEVE